MPHREETGVDLSVELTYELEHSYSMALYNATGGIRGLRHTRLLWIPLLSTLFMRSIRVACAPTNQTHMYLAPALGQAAALWIHQQEVRPSPNDTWIEVVHCPRQGWRGPMWLFHAVGSGIWLNTRRTLIFDDPTANVREALFNMTYVRWLTDRYDTLQIIKPPGDGGTGCWGVPAVEIILLAGHEHGDIWSIRNLVRCGRSHDLRECAATDNSLEMVARCTSPVDKAYHPHRPNSLNLPHVDVGWTRSAWLSCRENTSTVKINT